MQDKKPQAVNRSFITADGYRFHEMPDGRIVDNLDPDAVDMSFDSYEQMIAEFGDHVSEVVGSGLDAWAFDPIEHGSSLDTQICFAVGDLSRADLESTADGANVDYSSRTSTDDLRALVIDAAREAGGLFIYKDGVSDPVETYGFEVDKLYCYVDVEGEPSDEDDAGLPGCYLVAVQTGAAVLADACRKVGHCQGRSR